MFEWHEIQTDPNFGNYRIRWDERGAQLVLLDFGAVQAYSRSFIDPVCSMIAAAYREDLDGVINGGVALQFMRDSWPQNVLEQFGKVCMAVLEPLVPLDNATCDKRAWIDEHGNYLWNESDLPTRIAKTAAKSAVSRYFKIPPKEFVFLNRKLVGVYTFISVLRARFDGEAVLRKYL